MRRLLHTTDISQLLPTPYRYARSDVLHVYKVSCLYLGYMRRGSLNLFSLLAHDLVKQGRENKRLSWVFHDFELRLLL